MLPLNRFSEFASLTERERQLINQLADPPGIVPKNSRLRSEGDRPEAVYLLLEGWAGTSLALPGGGRQIMRVHLPGDLMGMPSLCLEHAAETLTAFSQIKVATIPHARLMALFTKAPRVAALIFLASQRERVALMDMTASLGRSSALARLASVLIDLHGRLRAIGLTEGNRLDLALTQEQLADMVGVTPVHVNRTLRELEQRGVIARHLNQVRLIDEPALRAMAGMVERCTVRDPEWLPAAGK